MARHSQWRHSHWIIPSVLAVILLTTLALGAPRVFSVEETDFVKIEPDIVDPDDDALLVSYTHPLDERGEWQTTFDDAGEYNISIIVSDGVNEVVQPVILIVKNKNQPPQRTQHTVTVQEGDVLDVRALVMDPDDDPLQFEFMPPVGNDGRWQTTFDDAGTTVLEFTADDGEFKEMVWVEVTVLNTNQPPVINDIFSSREAVALEEGETLHFWVEAEERDGEAIGSLWQLDRTTLSEMAEGEHSFGFTDAGEHSLTLTLSDGALETTREWSLFVENVNREPAVEITPITIQEGDLVSFDLPTNDIDGDPVHYAFEAPLNQEGQWQTTFDDAGEYHLRITASDGIDAVENTAIITVLDADRAPTLDVPNTVEVWEGGEASFAVQSSDPDNDQVRITFDNVPEGAEVTESMFTWSPGHRTIIRTGGFISTLLNKLRLEHFFLRTKVHPLTITSCGKGLCTSAVVRIVIHNVNQPPEFTILENITIAETGLVHLAVQAEDPDKDIVRYYFTSPLGRRSGRWQTSFEDEGIHEAYVTATDGLAGTTRAVQIRVENSNREPTILLKHDHIVVNEGQEFTLSVGAIDPDGDNLTLSVEDLPDGASFRDGTFVWAPGFEAVAGQEEKGWKNSFVSRFPSLNRRFNDNKEVLWLSFVASDGGIETIHPLKVTVKNVNRGPELLDYLPSQELTALVDQPLLFHVAAEDQDAEELEYTWNFGGKRQGTVTGTDTIERTFVTPGKKDVKVTVSDGLKEVEQEWAVNVVQPVVEEPVPAAPGIIPQEEFSFRVYTIQH